MGSGFRRAASWGRPRGRAYLWVLAPAALLPLAVLGFGVLVTVSPTSVHPGDAQGSTFLFVADANLFNSTGGALDVNDSCVEDAQDNNALGSAHVPCATSGWNAGDTIEVAANVNVGNPDGPPVQCTISWGGLSTSQGAWACSTGYVFGGPGNYTISATACQGSYCTTASSLWIHLGGLGSVVSIVAGGSAAIAGAAAAAVGLSGGSAASGAALAGGSGVVAPSGAVGVSATGPTTGEGYYLTGIGDYDPRYGAPRQIGPDGMPRTGFVSMEFNVATGEFVELPPRFGGSAAPVPPTMGGLP